GSPMPEVHHLWPLMTYWSPSRTMDDSMFVASDDATFGSVIANAERILPSSKGWSHVFLSSSVPYRSKTSMLPVSGAEQLKTSGAICERPISSHSGAYSRLVRPAPRWLSGRKRFQRPRSRAFSLSSSMIGGICQRVGPASSCSWKTCSFGWMYLFMKSVICSKYIFVFFEYSKSMDGPLWRCRVPDCILRVEQSHGSQDEGQGGPDHGRRLRHRRRHVEAIGRRRCEGRLRRSHGRARQRDGAHHQRRRR